jgi:hypothetical protein
MQIGSTVYFTINGEIIEAQLKSISGRRLGISCESTDSKFWPEAVYFSKQDAKDSLSI